MQPLLYKNVATIRVQNYFKNSSRTILNWNKLLDYEQIRVPINLDLGNDKQVQVLTNLTFDDLKFTTKLNIFNTNIDNWT